MHSRLSIAARNDLLEIAAYTRDQWGPKQALRYVARLESALRRIEKMPRLGRAAANVAPAYRKLQIGKHSIFYLLDEDGIFVVRILHERMLPAEHFR